MQTIHTKEGRSQCKPLIHYVAFIIFSLVMIAVVAFQWHSIDSTMKELYPPETVTAPAPSASDSAPPHLPEYGTPKSP